MGECNLSLDSDSGPDRHRHRRGRGRVSALVDQQLPLEYAAVRSLVRRAPRETERLLGDISLHEPVDNLVGRWGRPVQ